MRKLLILSLFWAAPLAAQTLPVQVKAVGAISYPNPLAVYNETLAPTAKGDTLFVVVGGTPAISDSQGNDWTLVPGTSSLWTATSAGGQETVTVTYPQVTYMDAVFAEYQGAWVLDAAAKEATGLSSVTASQSIAASAGDLVIGYGWNTTSNYLSVTAASPWTLEAFSDSIFLEDLTQSAAGSLNSAATWTQTANWTQGVAAFKPATPPAPPLTLNLSTVLVSCVKCDRSDDTPLSGSLVFEQGNNSQTFAIGAGGVVNLNLSIAMTTDPVSFTVLYQTSSGTEASGGGWMWTLPRASLSAGVATLGTLSFGGVAFTLNSDGSISFAGFLPAQ